MVLPVTLPKGWKRIKERGCPGDHDDGASFHQATVSVTLQLATLGGKTRYRAKGINIHLCEECIRLIHSGEGRKVRTALASAVQAQLVDIRRQQKGRNAA